MKTFPRAWWWLLAVLVLAAGWLGAGRADEGMWLFNDPPRKLLEKRYGFKPTDAWLNHLQRSAVRFNNGGSGSFVSADGLVMTNHHVGLDCLHKVSSGGKDYVKTGFHARRRSEEVRCPDLELNVLLSIEDVTKRVQGAVKEGMPAAAAERARRAVMNTIEEEENKKTGLRCDVVTLYHGAIYHLYRYKKYTDVRLVFAPEKQIAFFGGDPDNFEFPRYDLDVTFFRVYENDKPARVEHYLKWSRGGAKEDELVFVAGHPGHTDRLDTVRHLQLLRDVVNPLSLSVLFRREVLLRSWSERLPENARRAQDELFGYQNSRKARLGMLAGLQDPSIMNRKRTEEESLRAQVRKDPKLSREYGDAWDRAAKAIGAWQSLYLRQYLLERGVAFNSELFHVARGLVRLAQEKEKPNAERLREYRESNLASLRQQLFSPAPIYKDMETVKLGDSLSLLYEKFGADNPLVQKVLDGKSPMERAAALVEGSRLADVAMRKRLAEGGRKAIEDSDDPMIRLARVVDGPARAVRTTYEEKVEEPLRQAYSRIAGARFAVLGTSTYPDATFTLRLAFGRAKGYTAHGKHFPWATRIGGTFAHAQEHGDQGPFALPESWKKHRKQLEPQTPFDFLCTADIIGGNSGSPVVNRQGEVVGLIFDGNIYSLVLDMVYTEDRARAISVHSAAILEALRKVYDAADLAGELTGS